MYSVVRVLITELTFSAEFGVGNPKSERAEYEHWFIIRTNLDALLLDGRR